MARKHVKIAIVSVCVAAAAAAASTAALADGPSELGAEEPEPVEAAGPEYEEPLIYSCASVGSVSYYADTVGTKNGYSQECDGSGGRKNYLTGGGCDVGLPAYMWIHDAFPTSPATDKWYCSAYLSDTGHGTPTMNVSAICCD